MKPLFSLVVPVYNQAHLLPHLLDSVLAQRVDDMEVVVVDDCSGEPCGAVVEAYAGKGLDISLVLNAHRLNVKDSRLAGVASARGMYVGFADADDLLTGEGALREHLQRMAACDADVLHFRTMICDVSGNFSHYFTQADPFAPLLCGEDIFSAFAETDVGFGGVWNKIFSRRLFLEAHEILRESCVKFYCEDVFLNTLLLFHAKKYLGSDRCAYKYLLVDKTLEESLPRALALYSILEKALPYLRQHSCRVDVLQSYRKKMRLAISTNIGRACIQAGNDKSNLVSEKSYALFLSSGGTELLIKTLIFGGAANAEKSRACFRAIAGICKETGI